MQPNDHVEEPQSFQIYPPKTDLISDFWRDKYENDAKKYWDVFYKRNMDKFFKDRHYLDKEWGFYFQRLAASPSSERQDESYSGISSRTKAVLEIGCGTGNTVFPLLATYPDMFIYACDFSQRAVNLLKNRKEYMEERIHAFICDVTSESLSSVIPVDTVDIATLVFTLSAVSPSKMPEVLQNIRKVLKPNAHVLIRDYAVGDLAQERLSNKVQKISESFYVRGDGTRVFYFSEIGLSDLFRREGFSCESIKIHEKRVENRGREIVMERRWIQGVFCLVDASCSCGNSFDGHGFSNSIDGHDVDLSEGIANDMFGVPHLEVIPIELGEHRFNIKSLSKENQHRCQATGFMLWESAHVLASLLAKNNGAIAFKTVLELGCGSAGICSMIAAMGADLVVATDGDADALALLADNLEANRHFIRSGNLITLPLKWGCLEHIEQVKERTGCRGFEIIFGTDVTYVAEAIPLLFATANALIAEAMTGKPEPLVLLCHVVRKVDDFFISDVASQYGFILEDKWPESRSETDKDTVPRAVASMFPCGLDEVSEIYGSVEILCFRQDGKRSEKF